jgi:AmmeMemoRadiSam system radical SAM enzyme/AmmeMemoRadiSam system protein B/AmmeMemoRadiSam system protein A
MTRTVVLPASATPDSSGSVDGGWWHQTGQDGRILCDLCPRECNMKPGDRGFCFVRQNIDGQMKLTTYGKSTGFCIDPVEKKPLNHFYPGTSVLSFGTAGCNLGCQFCQNWDISKSREVERLSELAMPETIAVAARQLGCRSVAFTYNDPIVWAEYAMDSAAACRREGIKSIAVTAGYISPAARPAFFHAMDAANVDLKAFTEDFYQKITYSHLQPVLDTLTWLKHESDVWFEITNLVIPDANDSPDELQRMCEWIMNSVGPDVPLHFSAFHPDFRMTNRGRTPHETLLRAYEIAKKAGVNYVYVGNVNDVKHQSTYCPQCKNLLIERNNYQLGRYNLQGAQCGFCSTTIAGHFDSKPGQWGPRRLPVRISDYVAPKQQPIDLRQGEVRVPVESLLTPAEGARTKTQGTGTAVRQQQNPRTDSAKTATANVPERSPSMQPVKENPSLTAEQESAIHQAACELVLAAVRKQPVQLKNSVFTTVENVTVMGVFVTLKREGQLRGCCGMQGQPMALIHGLTQSAARTATEDHRFPPVSLSELPHLTVDVTLLYNFEKVTVHGEGRVAAVETGRHGLRIQDNNKAGLLLPFVAIEHGMDARTFLDQVCRKAGLPSNAWQEPTALLERFEGRMIEGRFPGSLLASQPVDVSFPCRQDQVPSLVRLVRDNLLALVQGAVPGCFPANCPDGTVDGIALQLSLPNSASLATFSHIQYRGGVPLQSTLLQLTQAAAESLRKTNANFDFCSRLTIDLALFADPAFYGPLQSADVTGLDVTTRAVVVTESRKTAWCFDPKSPVNELLQKTAGLTKVTDPSTALVSSFAVRCSAATMWTTNVPQPQAVQKVRPAGVAGTFYPGDPAGLSLLLDQCIGPIPEEKADWPAVMVPHAGLIYSGRIAAGVLKQIRIPDTVIVLGPKHTSAGVEWAVAPNETWQLPGTTLASNRELAGLLAERVDGLQLDAAAHAREHAIEVQLPFLARLAPHAKVVGIVIGGGSPERCRQFGRQLAAVISELPSPPLLVISSDMHHFANDVRNRELDELALTAMESLDPLRLLQTVTSNNISMCGVLPAVIVMEALRCLNQLTHMERAGYATSADVSGDKSRVVGYAGMLLGRRS